MTSKAMGGLIGAASLMWIGIAPALGAPFMIVGNDEKITWDDEGKLVLSPPGRDSVVILDLAEPETPRVVATLPLKNSVVGPPVNLAIGPHEQRRARRGLGGRGQGRRGAPAGAR